MKSVAHPTRWVWIAVCVMAALSAAALAEGGVALIFDTDATCAGNDINLFADKSDVYIDGIGLPDGLYYIQVTDLEGNLLGTSVGTAYPMPITVVGNRIVQCYQLWAILVKASDGTPGYDDSNSSIPAGHVYKVWVSANPAFPAGETWLDKFIINPEVPPRELHVVKYYDANRNGSYDTGEQFLDGWQIHIQDGIDWVRSTPVDIQLPPDIYIVTELMPLEPNWVCTTTNPWVADLTLANKPVKFGNVCFGSGGGRTPGFWSNKNGQGLIGEDDLLFLRGLNLRNLDGAHFDPVRYGEFRSWLLNANATNMAYMLSVHMASMNLNVAHGFVDEDALIYAPGTGLEDGYGFATVRAVLDQANYMLGLYPTAYPEYSWRIEMEALKTALSTANDDTGFFQPEPCPYTFQ